MPPPILPPVPGAPGITPEDAARWTPSLFGNQPAPNPPLTITKGAKDIPAEARESRAQADTACSRGIIFPTAKGLVSGVANAARKAVGVGANQPAEGDTVTLCWSDIWVYGVGIVLVGGGLVMLLGGRK
jgi:hypothetical protein